MDILKEYADGIIPADRLIGATLSRDLSGLNGSWTILPERSGPMTDITEVLGLDKLDRMAWELSLQLSSPRFSLTYLHTPPEEGGYPLLRVDCHCQLGVEYIRDVCFDGKRKDHVQLGELVPRPPLQHMSSGFDEGELLAIEHEGHLYVRYDMRKGSLYMTRVLMQEDPLHEVKGPITLAKYCAAHKATGVKHEVYRYHRKVRGASEAF